MEKYSCYEFEVYHAAVNAGKFPEWCYRIKYWHDYYCNWDYIDGGEWFDTEQEARFAAIGHIDKLENGDDHD